MDSHPASMLHRLSRIFLRQSIIQRRGCMERCSRRHVLRLRRRRGHPNPVRVVLRTLYRGYDLLRQQPHAARSFHAPLLRPSAQFSFPSGSPSAAASAPPAGLTADLHVGQLHSRVPLPRRPRRTRERRAPPHLLPSPALAAAAAAAAAAADGPSLVPLAGLPSLPRVRVCPWPVHRERV